MNINEQQALRDKVGALMLEWAEGREPPFTGEGREGFDDAILAAHLIADEGRLNLQRWVEAARRSGLSWTQVGEVLGISKQAAQQRFRTAQDDEALPDAGEAERIVRYGATAFNEMSMMRTEGEQGHELVDVGPLALVFRPTQRRWQYRRIIGTNAAVARMEREGWSYVASWLPFLYYKRPAD